MNPIQGKKLCFEGSEVDAVMRNKVGIEQTLKTR